MHFNGTILEFYQKFSSFNLEKLTLIESKDPFWTKLINNKYREINPSFVSRWGEDLTREWVSEVWFDLCLFPDENTYFLYDVEKSREEVLKLLAGVEDFSRPLFLHYQKEPKGLKKSLSAKYSTLKIKEFNFWEIDKLLDFYSIVLSTKFSSAIYSYFSNWSLDLKREIFDLLTHLKLIFEDLSDANQEQLDAVIDTQDLNPFNLVDYLKEKDMKNIYRNLLTSVQTENWLSSHKAITFLRSFVLKSADPYYRAKKERLNIFDKKILAVQDCYSLRELSMVLKDLSAWEIQVKRKDHAIVKDLESKIISLG